MESKLSSRRARALEREAEALRLRVAGASLSQIAAAIGVRSDASAHKALARGLARLAEISLEAATQLRAVEGERLERLHATWWPLALQGDGEAADRILRIAARRARLYGLDQPPREEVPAPPCSVVILPEDQMLTVQQWAEKAAPYRERHKALVEEAMARVDAVMAQPGPVLSPEPPEPPPAPRPGPAPPWRQPQQQQGGARTVPVTRTY